MLQNGVQILAGFLLTLPFQQRFAELSRTQVSVYLSLVVLSALILVGLTRFAVGESYKGRLSGRDAGRHRRKRKRAAPQRSTARNFRRR